MAVKKTNIDNNNVYVFNFENHKLPEFKEVASKEWILYGEDNIYPQYLTDLFARCSKHNAIILGKLQMILGDGLKENNVDFDKLFYNGVNEDLKRITLDYLLFGALSFIVEFGVATKKIVKIKHIPLSTLRVKKDSTSFYYCKDWADSKLVAKKEFKIYPACDFDNPSGEMIYYYKDYRPLILSYGVPDYIGAVASIETDIEISNFHLNNIKNGFSSSVMINFNNGVPLPEKQKEIAGRVQGKHTGTDKAGKIMVNFSDGKDKSPEVLTLTPSDLDKQFMQLRTDSTQEIFTGHQITSPMLFGIKEAGQLGGRTELLEAFELFQNNYIANKQKTLENIFNELTEYNGMAYEMEIKRSKPISMMFSESVLTQVLDRNELREMIGYEQVAVAVDNNDINEKVNQLSPLVANSVLRNLTVNELRKLIGLEPIEGGDDLPTTGEETQFSSQASIELFKKYGESESEYEIIKESKFINFEDYTELDKQIVEQIKKQPLIDLKSLGSISKRSQEVIAERIETLVKAGVIKQSIINDNGTSIIKRELTNVAKEVPKPIQQISVMYKYSGVKDSKNRDFCRELLNLSKLYTRTEIETISNELGYNVFMMRGGYYHNPKTDITTPYCRHEWKQVSVVKKQK
jgi:DNA-binding Lrp family transcriptional regulator